MRPVYLLCTWLCVPTPERLSYKLLATFETSKFHCLELIKVYNKQLYVH